ncbi:hypothetical protein [Parenemella sanctibonifatiensis]|uniref:Uncharacterized protein n=1 Tax=Parenemella sanctibonifatiensis TaxID=2016505 RepID=A0A255E2M0_9ACTN|nr:hypothetical protein [Parenemella sanctibonifatiensis]OYN85221.1 hypothetical protein CGZ92_10415 [Parenemella sanctibonifatiensis]
MHSIKSIAKILLVAVGLLVALPSVAFAEGSYNGSFYRVFPGWNDRYWWDNNQDGSATTVTLSNCQLSEAGATHVVIRLWKNNWGPLPDESRGDRNVSACSSPKTGNWSRQTAVGEYRYQIRQIGSNQMVNLTGNSRVVW